MLVSAAALLIPHSLWATLLRGSSGGQLHLGAIHAVQAALVGNSADCGCRDCLDIGMVSVPESDDGTLGTDGRPFSRSALCIVVVQCIVACATGGTASDGRESLLLYLAKAFHAKIICAGIWSFAVGSPKGEYGHTKA
jgi:hypothetical protein